MKSMIFVCVALCFMAVVARVYMAGGIDGVLNPGLKSGEATAKVPQNVTAVTTDKDVEIFKWRDEQGVMHFGERPPEFDTIVEKVDLRTNENVMKAVKVTRDVVESADTGIQQVNVDNPYSPEGMSQLLQQTQALTDSINKQQEGKKEMLDNILQQ